MIGIAAAALVALAPAGPAAASKASDELKAKQAQQAAVRQQRAEVAAKLDVLKANAQQMHDALATLDENVQEQAASTSAAAQAADQAVRASALADQHLADTQAQLAQLVVRSHEIALDAYVNPSGTTLVDLFVASSQPDVAMRRGLLDYANQRNLDVVGHLDATRKDLVTERQRAAQAAADAAAAKAAAEAALANLQAAKGRQQQLASRVETQVAATEAQSTQLAAIDAQLTKAVADAQAALAAEIARLRAGGGKGSGNGAPRGVSIVNVHGFWVNASVAGRVNAMLNAASAAGVNLGGSAFRSPQLQVNLRRQNCGPSRYAIFDAPPSACSPPTARPGASMHEVGLAIDFEWNGAAITSHANPGFRWLAANAARYGFYNYGPEPWHWSVNGH
jgi:LAS superfamily LD-carboxypeptidase LdcB